MTNNTDPVRELIGEMTEYLDQQVDPELDVIAKWRDRLESALASAPPSAPVGVEGFDKRFAEMLLGILSDVQDELGFTDEDKMCANGSAEIVAEIRELKRVAALAQQPAAVDEAVVEAVARAICMACEDNPDHQGDARGNESRWQDYRNPALAAISALAAQQQLAAASAAQQGEN